MSDPLIEYDDLVAITGGHAGVYDAACPLCGPGRKRRANQIRKVMRVWDDGDGFVSWTCARCEEGGWAKDKAAGNTTKDRPARPAPTRKEPEEDKSGTAQFLWRRSEPLVGSIAETYLRSRSCFVDSPSVRFLPARGDHTATMVSRFGFPGTTITGVHLTKLAPDGRGKAGTDADKLTLGATMGQPIVVHDNPDRGELIVAEGIEDAASLALVTGWTAWAAGTANRIAPVLSAAAGFEQVFLAVDSDAAGERNLARARAARPNLIPIRFDKLLGGDEPDANTVLRQFGADALLAAIEWCEANAAYRSRRIGFHAMQKALTRANTVFTAMVPDQLA